jgi:hypothetical protein
MGSIRKVIKKVKKAVKKPISKAFKGIAKGILKVGKATMRGIASLNKKLGPIGSIALSIAMPYALAGLSTGTTALMKSSNVFLKSIGTVGNSIRTGYQAFNAGISKTFSTITNSISKGFKNFAPEGAKNMFSSISRGAKNLYTSAKNKLKSLSPKFRTAKVGQSEVFGLGQAAEGPMLMDNTLVAEKIKSGALEAGQVNMKSLTESGGWFTKGNTIGTQADKIVTDTINDAYKKRLSGFGDNAMRMYNDVRKQAIDLGTYVNDEQIGSFVENNIATKNSLTEAFGPGKYQIKTEISDLAKTGDYNFVPGTSGESGFYEYTGNKTFANINKPSNLKSKAYGAAKKIGSALSKSLLNKSEDALEIPISNQGEFVNSNKGMYTGTDIVGTSGGTFIEDVFGTSAANRFKTYHQNMNIHGSY